MLRSQAGPSGTSIYSSLCWNCIRKQRANALRQASTLAVRTKRRSSRNGTPHKQERSLHTIGNLRQQSALATSDPTPPPFIPSPIQPPSQTETKVPIRQQLAKWQEEQGNPLSELLGIDVTNAPTLANNATINDEVLPDRAEIPESGNFADGDELFSDRGVYYKPGDLVELPGNLSGIGKLAIYIRSISTQQDQVLTIRGKWMNVAKSKFPWTIPDFVQAKDVEPILPYLPTAEVAEEMLDQAIVMDVNAPRSVSAPLVDALKAFSSAADDVYRNNASVLDSAHARLSHQTDLRFGSLAKIASKLLKGTHHSEQAIYAVRTAVIRAGTAFGSDSDTHRTGIFQIRSREQVELIKMIQQWLRDYQESKIRMAAAGAHGPTETNFTGTAGAQTVHDFIKKCKKLIMQSRKWRQADEHGFLGPSKDRYPLDHPDGAFHKRPREEFTKNERLIIRFLEYWCLQALFFQNESLQALCPLILHETGLYQYSEHLHNHIGLTFLMEIGVLEPYVNRKLFDVNLLLPSSQHSKPLQQLATDLSKLSPEKVKLPDTMKDLRHDFKDLTVFCIDGSGAQEIDDGISVERIQGSTDVWVHIHIANPSAFVKQDTVFAKMAGHMTESFYSPDSIWPMLPRWMSRGMFGLEAGRPTLTFSAKLNEAGEIVDYKIQNGTIHNVASMTYLDLPEILGVKENTVEAVSIVVGGEGPKRGTRKTPKLPEYQREELRLIHSLSTARYKHRRKHGGVYFQTNWAEVNVYHKEGVFGLPESYPHRRLGMHIKGDPVIELQAHQWSNWFDPTGDDSTEHLVREMMILACEVAGRFAVDRKMPSIFRGMQRNPHAKFTAAEFEREVVQPAEARLGTIPIALGLELVASHGRSVLRTSAIKHPLMGLNQYCQVTSPLRRYGDMIIHWQIESALREESLTGNGSMASKNRFIFSEPQMASMARSLHPRERLIRHAKSTCESHWITQFFFRAWTFNELPSSSLPRRFPIIITSHHSSGSSEARRGAKSTFGCSLDWGSKIIISPLDMTEEFRREAATGDIWEVEVTSVNSYARCVNCRPVGLVRKDDLTEIGREAGGRWVELMQQWRG